MAANKDPELPDYSGATVPSYAATSNAQPTAKTEHKYALETKGREWLFIHVKSRAPANASLPYFVEADIIEGSVELNLDKPESVKGVTIQILAGATSVGQEEFIFLDLKQDLWPTGSEKGGKLDKGKHAWSFSFTLPTKVEAPTDMKGKITIEAPPSFSERASPAYIDYRIVATVKRGALKPNQTLTKSFAYMPLVQPDPPSKLRQMAYKDGTELLGPEIDIDGWKVLQPVKVKGKLFDAKEVEIECTLALAKPLAYVIGAPVPLFLTLKSDDEVALDTVSNPNAIKMHLVRSIALGSDAMEERTERRSNTFFQAGVGQAYFWPAMEGGKEPGKRVLRGEVEVKKSIKPSFMFPRFTTRYTMDLLPFSITGFAPDKKPTALLSEPVKIVSKHIPGIVPRSYAPPGYKKPVESDYNAAVGYLENGNQRFYHRGGFA
ncbi:hypothetical protein MIND_00263800 [Mycena indigotica]|uniref:Arrestin-like N-terminal domain-containing protein n=1 Tax=Mycena indigotica TaxID=2126181 RepID=A0A8H6T7S6_9AGAR|nr:uncharacterized protein MIND_00263800 [Mycena indigotica]KAF7312501.1 hypothetical protein MIND_00263800 [Mycena indigotica]